MRRLLAPLTAIGLSTLALLLAHLGAGGGTAQELVQIGADTKATGNTATSLGPPDNCTSVDSGESFPLDIFVSDVQDLVHWELYVKFDPPILEVVDADARMFLATNPRSSLTVQSIPLSGGRHFIGAVDTRGAPESGSGVLARMTMKANASGLSELTIPSVDSDLDGDIDLGPRLTADGGLAVGDFNGDGVFDGPTYHAVIAVDRSCDEAPVPTPSLPPSPTPGQGGNGSSGGNGDGDDEGNADNEGDGDNGTPSGSGPGDDGDAQGDGSPEPVVLRGDRTPDAADGDGSGGRELGGRSSSSDGGLPWWAIGLISGTVLVASGGTGVYIARRFSGN